MIIFMGGPGVGKGTFAQMLREREHEHFVFVETGALLRAQPADSEIGRTLARGDLVSDDVIREMLTHYIKNDADMLLDGFPRTLGQAQWLVEHYADVFDIHVIYLYVNDDVLRARIKKRLGQGSARADDSDADVINHRISTYRKSTLPAVEWLRDASGVRFNQVDVSGAVDDNFANIMRAIVAR